MDLEYRIAFVDEICARWRGRLKGLPPYRAGGYRMYLYQDLATVSVVAETPEGCPYGGNLEFFSSIREVMSIYVDRKWSDVFPSLDWPHSDERILTEIEKQSGSISRPTAEALGVSVGQLRKLIEQICWIERSTTSANISNAAPPASSPDRTPR
jgi:hypothetical protein